MDDEKWYREILMLHLSQNPDFEVIAFDSGKECLENLHLNPDVLSVDFHLGDTTGDTVLKTVKAYLPQANVIMVSNQENIKTAVSLLKQGAYDYLTKDEETPYKLEWLLLRVQEKKILENKVKELEGIISSKNSSDLNVIGQSQVAQNLRVKVKEAISHKHPVIITGKIGTEKEEIAKTIHFLSDLKNNSFVSFHCGSYSFDQLEKELYGDGIETSKIGNWELAQNGTLFINEVEILPVELQIKLYHKIKNPEKNGPRVILSANSDLNILNQKKNTKI